MANELTIFKNGAAAPSKVFEQSKVNADAIDAGIGAGFASVRYKGAKWAIKFQGEAVGLRRWDSQGRDDGPAPFLDCVIVDAAAHPSKQYYEGAYTEGDTSTPDCFSATGVNPDRGSPKPQSPTCAGCKWNGWGSKITHDGTVSKGKQCADHKRLVVVPVGDILNKAYGGPMMLQIPPMSLKKLAPYKQMLGQAGLKFNQVWTRIGFDGESAFPLLEFDAIRTLTDDEARQVLEVEDDPMCDRILNGEVVGVEGYDPPPPLRIPGPATVASAPTPITPPKPTAPPPVSTPAPVKAPDPVTPPPQMTLPPGMTQESYDKFVAWQKSQEAPAEPVEARPVARRGRRTAAVAPTNASSEPAQRPAEAQQQMPLQLGPKTTTVPVTGDGNGHDLNPDAVQDISALIEKLV